MKTNMRFFAVLSGTLWCLFANALQLETEIKDPGPWKLSVERVELEKGLEEFTLTLKSETAARPPVVDAFFVTSGADAHNVWVPMYEGSERSRLYASEWGTVRYRSELGRNYPICCAYNENGDNRLSIAASECLRTVLYAITVHSTDAKLEGRFRFFSVEEAPRTEYSVKILVDRRKAFFANTIAQTTRWIEKTGGYTPCQVPEAAFDPLYSSWYAFWQDVHDKTLEQEAAIAASLGMTSMILDDGWQKTQSKHYYSATGDWMPVKSRFPNFRKHVDAVHAAGIKNYLLWLSVPFVGNESKAYAHFKDKLLSGSHTGVLDPRFPEVRKYLIDTYVRCLRDWDFDGLKLDFIDAITYSGRDPAEKDNWRGRDYRTVPEAVDRLMKDVRAALIAIKPNALIEFRQRYTGPAIRQYGNMLRATDCPSDLVGNRRRIADLRIASGGTAVHADMLLWSRDDSPENAARVILNAIFGVVQYSMRLNGLPEKHKELIRHWINFSQKHRNALLKGTFRPYHPELMYPMIEAADDTERIVAVYDDRQIVKCAADKKEKDLYLINASHRRGVVCDFGGVPRIASVEIFNTMGELVSRLRSEDIAFNALDRLDIPTCGYAKIVFKDEVFVTAPVNGATVNLLTPEQKKFFDLPAAVKRIRTFHTAERELISRIGYHPAKVRLAWEGTERNDQVFLKLWREPEHRLVRDIFFGYYHAVSFYDIDNLEAGAEYSWEVGAVGKNTARGTFRTAWDLPRMLNVPNIPNARDLGGYCGLNGRRVKQGRMFRSSAFNENGNKVVTPGPSRMDAAGIFMMTNTLGVRTEIDLRYGDEIKGMKESPLGPSVAWLSLPGSAYQWMNEKEAKERFKKIFNVFLDEHNYPITFHCIAGQDRTGTVAFLLNALLGVSEADLLRDWEATFLWNLRTGWFLHKNRYDAMLAFFNTFPGETINARVENYVRSLGFTAEDLAHFRELNLEPVK